LKIIDHTKEYLGQDYINFINALIGYVPESDLTNIGTINIYDKCPKHYPVIAQGAYWPPDNKGKGAVDIYLDQCFGHMLTFNNKSKINSKIADSLFVTLFGKKHLAHTIFHEIRHLVYEQTGQRVKKKESEKFAEEYALNLYYKAYPSQRNWSSLTNKIYKTIYSSRIQHDENKRKKL
jgi:hypothetical protein